MIDPDSLGSDARFTQTSGGAAFSRLRKTLDPCLACGLHRTRCICAQIPSLNLKTRIALVIHAKELKRTTNTGCLALRALTNSQLCVRGATRERVDLTSLLNPAYETVLLYPSDTAIPLDRVSLACLSPTGKPLQVIVPDGNWRQAGKVALRHPELAHVKRISVTRPDGMSRQNMRLENTKDGMATLQAIACVLGWLEGESVGQQLMQLYELKRLKTLEGRGTPGGELGPP